VNRSIVVTARVWKGPRSNAFGRNGFSMRFDGSSSLRRDSGVERSSHEIALDQIERSPLGTFNGVGLLLLRRCSVNTWSLRSLKFLNWEVLNRNIGHILFCLVREMHL
jgi:hypothetical protein